MSFSPTQNEQIYQFLGYDAEDADAALDARIAAVTARGAVAEGTVIDLLTKIAAVETALASSGSSTSTAGGLKKADDIEWYDVSTSTTSSSLSTIEYGQLLISRLAARLALDPAALPSDYFGSFAVVSATVVSGQTAGW